MAFRFDDHGQPLDTAELSTMIIAWRLARARLAPNAEPFRMETQAVASRERLTMLLRALADVAAGQMLAVAALALGEDSTKEEQISWARDLEEQISWARDLADQAIADQTMAAHAVDLGDEPEET
jgi:hypothetical protein